MYREDINDYELIYLVSESEENYQLLFDKYHPILEHFVYQYLVLAKKYGLDYDDLYQAGRMGLYYATTHYKEKREVTFYTYAVLCMRGKIINTVKISAAKKNDTLNQALSLSVQARDYATLEEILPSGDNLFDLALGYDLECELIRFKHSLELPACCVFELYKNGFTAKEIAILLDLTYQRVRNLIYFVKKKLLVYLNTQKYI